MQIFSATDVGQSFGSALDAAQKEPVFIRKQDLDVAVLLSVQAYERLVGIARSEFDRVCDTIAAKAKERGLTEEKFNELTGDIS